MYNFTCQTCGNHFSTNVINKKHCSKCGSGDIQRTEQKVIAAVKA